MSIELPDARHLSDEALQVLRLRALRGVELGYSEVELADLLTHLVEEARSLVGAHYAALGVLNETRTGLEQFITSQRRNGLAGMIQRIRASASAIARS